MRIYTKKGDKGQSSLFGGDPVSKADPRLQAYGTLDELNAALGLARAHLNSAALNLGALDAQLLQCQNYLFTLGSHLAVGDERLRSKLPALNPEFITQMESQIDVMEALLTPLTNFILPGGSVLASTLHLARTVARRAERAVVELQPAADNHILVYLNRLSDFLFVSARFANKNQRQTDVLWEKS